MRMIVTESYRKKMADASLGNSLLPKITVLALGDGAIDSNGSVIDLSGTEQALRNELLRVDVSKSVDRIGDHTIGYSLQIKEDTLPGKRINELALYDADGAAAYIKVFEPREKRAETAMTFKVECMF